MRTVYITAPPEAAATIATTLVEERLAACVNRVSCRSTYHWDGEVHHDDEEVLLAKTTVDRRDDLVARVEAVHPYDVPCIETFGPEDTLPAFANWCEDAVATNG